MSTKSTAESTSCHPPARLECGRDNRSSSSNSQPPYPPPPVAAPSTTIRDPSRREGQLTLVDTSATIPRVHPDALEIHNPRPVARTFKLFTAFDKVYTCTSFRSYRGERILRKARREPKCSFPALSDIRYELVQNRALGIFIGGCFSTAVRCICAPDRCRSSRS